MRLQSLVALSITNKSITSEGAIGFHNNAGLNGYGLNLLIFSENVLFRTIVFGASAPNTFNLFPAHSVYF